MDLFSLAYQLRLRENKKPCTQCHTSMGLGLALIRRTAQF